MSPFVLRRFRASVLLAMLRLAAPPAMAAGPAKKSPPNVIMIVTDDLNDWVGPMNSPIRAKTPNLDRLAARGVIFQNAQAAGVFCAPARTAVLTGRHPSTTGAYGAQIYHYDHPELRPLQVALQQGGYATYGTGKIFHHPAGYVDLRGWDDFFVRTEEQRKTGWGVDTWQHGAPLPATVPYSAFTRQFRSD
ncbi:MAG: sulfatase-like hydrolase/transferase, partial [Vicinamibacteria bacterium]|nr:sulfatase-like hydrolase/transferase [Vicinamibacteria bacterium]